VNLLPSPTLGQIAAQVDAVLRHDPGAVVMGIRAQVQGQWPDQLALQERAFKLVWCPSPISVRQALLECEEIHDQSGMVILTPVDDANLGYDVLARLARGRVFAVDSWDMLRNVFQARELDSRLAAWPWLAEVLLANLPAEGYPPTPGGFLDVHSAWAHGLRIVLCLSAGESSRIDLEAVLKWSLDAEKVHRYAILPELAKRQITAWLNETLGGAGRLALRGLTSGFGLELVPLGIVCGVVFGGYAETSSELLAAAVRLEKYFGGSPIYPDDTNPLYQAARKLLDGLDAHTQDRVLDAGDRLFQSLHLLPYTHLSNDLPGGLEARLIRLGDAIRRYLENPCKDLAREIHAAMNYASQHRLAPKGALRKLRMEMAAKLVHRLELERQSTQTKPATGFAGSVLDYIRDGAFIDRARLSLLGGDELPGLTQSYNLLRERARELREVQNQRFAEALEAWYGSGCAPLDDVVPVECLLNRVVEPLARKTPVLLLVMDGLSYPIFLEIVDDILRSGWSEVWPGDRSGAYAGLAAIPSITEISRASLLCGRICSGPMAQEKSGFSSHPDLVAISKAQAKPLVFHKGELADGVGLSEEVRNTVGKPDHRVVAVVYNGVDDHLSGSDQMQPHWNLDSLRLIRPLLYEARLAGRAIVLTSDHGHVIDESTVLNGSGIGDRWRSLEPAPGPHEKRLEGGRVLAPTGENKVVVPWSEALRYGQKKNGYHGGISLQEMVIPLCLLIPPGAAQPDGYRLVGPSFPDWWELSGALTTPRAAEPKPSPEKSTVPRKAKKAASDQRQVTLFEEEPEQTGHTNPPTIDWIEPILSSSLFRAQKQLAARATLRDDEIRTLLEALAERGGKISKPALAQRLGLPLMRVSGFVNAARRLLNIDQVTVLILDETEGTVMLNRELLEKQFREAKP